MAPSKSTHSKKSQDKAVHAMSQSKKSNIKKKDSSMNLKFKSVFSVDDTRREEKHIRKMTFAERLKLEENEKGDCYQYTQFGEKQLSYSIKDNTTAKFQKLREKNDQHAKDRKKLCRSSKKLKGKVNRNPLA